MKKYYGRIRNTTSIIAIGSSIAWSVLVLAAAWAIRNHKTEKREETLLNQCGRLADLQQSQQ